MRYESANRFRQWFGAELAIGPPNIGNVSMANKVKLGNINCLAPEGKKPREDVVKQL